MPSIDEFSVTPQEGGTRFAHLMHNWYIKIMNFELKTFGVFKTSRLFFNRKQKVKHDSSLVYTSSQEILLVT